MTRIVIGLFSATAVLLGGVFVVLLVSVISLREDDSRARKSSDVLLQALAVERSVVDLETGLRGFLLTGQARFLEPYEQARERLPAQLGSLRHLAGNGRERAWVDELSTGISRYIEDYAMPLLGSGARLSAAQKVAVTSRGKQLVDSLRSSFDALEAGQLAARERNRADANSGGSLALIAAAVGLVISLSLLLGQRISAQRTRPCGRGRRSGPARQVVQCDGRRDSDRQGGAVERLRPTRASSARGT
jgi:CHASE3 domain sensor protein